ncbi:MAG: cholesterol esterase [Geoglossum simile]|nr:MAG: cholesterol esterase [Geoglossum simile]
MVSTEAWEELRTYLTDQGLLMNSEVWVCLTEKERCLPFMLVERGFDVWLGNNRGNKYSKKSINHPPTSLAFWNFSMDEFAFHDIPDSISYILSTTSQPSLSYIGFSQGTAQAFATLSIHPGLNDKVDVFIALAPAMSPAGLHNGVVDALIKASPEVIFLAFGRRSILGSTTMWQSILYPPIFVRIIDMSLGFLFNWSGCNISAHQKLAAYPHLYSFTSTKSVVHWFQVIRNKSFQMYDDDVAAPLAIGGGAKYYKVAKFPTRNIKTPIVLVYGGSDSLVDIQVMLKELPKHTVAQEIPHFEHLDFLWGNDVNKLVFPYVFDALDSYSDPAHPKEKHSLFKTTRHGSLSRSEVQQPPSYSEDERLTPTRGGGKERRGRYGTGDGARDERPNSEESAGGSYEERTISNQPAGALSPLPESPLQASPESHSASATQTPSSSTSPSRQPATSSTVQRQTDQPTPSTKRPPTEFPSSIPTPHTSRITSSMRRSKSGSFSSLDSAASASTTARPGIGSEGISLGMGRPVGGIVSRGVEGGLANSAATPGRSGTGGKRRVIG